MSERGGIRNADAYARGKMLDHSAWQREVPLPNLVTPSDIDMVFDNKGWILFCEISSQYAEWPILRESKGGTGQVRLYEAAVEDSIHCAVLCKHSVPLVPQRPIDSRADIESFQVMLYDPQHGLLTTELFRGNAVWQRFVHLWFIDTRKVRRGCLQSALKKEAA